MAELASESQAVPQPLWLRLREWVKGLPQMEREEQFTREEQLSMVWSAHLLIMLGVGLILRLGFGAEAIHGSLKVFWFSELAIIGLAFIVTNTRSKPLVSGIKKVVTTLNWFERWMDRHGDAVKSRIQAATLLFVYTLQFAAMASLLAATGGPIDSPFAPMALAIAIFTPFIVNKWWTVGMIIITTMTFYTVFVALAGFSGDEIRADRGSYAAVNLFILILASVMTFRRRDNMSITVRRTFDVSREKVWEAWTERTQVARWFGLNGNAPPDIELDLRVGGTWRAAMMRRDGTPGMPWSGVYREIEAPKRLVFTVDGRSGRGEEIVEVELEEKDGKTEMVVKQSDASRYAGLKEGWSAFFDRMDDYFEPRDGP